MDNNKINIYVFQWISDYGGADTRLKDIIVLWSRFANVTLIPNFNHQLEDKNVTNYLDSHNIKYRSKESLINEDISGFAISLGNSNLFNLNIHEFIKKKGLYFIYSNEMMNLYEKESNAISEKYIDKVLYTSIFNENKLKPLYEKYGFTGKGHIIYNYVNPEKFLLSDKIYKNEKRSLNIGRLSRACISKYSNDFVELYEYITKPNDSIYIQGWDNSLTQKYGKIKKTNWKLYEPLKLPSNVFLRQLDVFVYKVNETYEESYGRVIVEAMLSGVIPVTQTGHAFGEIFLNGVSGFQFDNKEECKEIIEHLRDPILRSMYMRNAKNRALTIQNEIHHIEEWKKIFIKD